MFISPARKGVPIPLRVIKTENVFLYPPYLFGFLKFIADSISIHFNLWTPQVFQTKTIKENHTDPLPDPISTPEIE